MPELLSTLKDRLALKASFTDFCRLAGYEPAQHHLLIIQALEKLGTEHRKIMIFMPPGSAKSTYASVLFPPGGSPTTLIAASWRRAIQKSWPSGSADAFVTSSEFTPCSSDSNTDPTNRAAGRWKLVGLVPESAGEYMAAGAGSAIAGFRADLGLIDDPVRGREQVTERNPAGEALGLVPLRLPAPAETPRGPGPDHDPVARGRPRRPHP